MPHHAFDKPIPCRIDLGTRRKLERLQELRQRREGRPFIPIYLIAHEAIEACLADELKRQGLSK